MKRLQMPAWECFGARFLAALVMCLAVSLPAAQVPLFGITKSWRYSTNDLSAANAELGKIERGVQGQGAFEVRNGQLRFRVQSVQFAALEE